MKFYQFNMWREKDNLLGFSPVVEKEVGSSPIVIEENKVSILEWFDQEHGKTLLFVAGSRLSLDAFLDGFQLGIKSNTLLVEKDK